MVTGNQQSSSSFDYQAEYNRYWSSEDRIGESSGDLEETASQIVISCGLGRTLDIGSGEGLLVESLLRRCVDAHGLDVSQVVVSRCNRRIPGRFTNGSVLNLPFGDAAFQTIVSTDCLEHLSPGDIPRALQEIYRVSGRYVFLQIATTQDRDGHWHLTVEGRAWWEARCFEAGFRKHPAYYRLNDYESLNQDGRQIVIILEKIPDAALRKYPLSVLKEERDLHMDMLRESGSRSDAHVGRYFFAAKYIRPGDRVLDAACGLGYGSHVLNAITKARCFTAVDDSEFAITYARTNFVSGSLNFQQGRLPECLESIPSNSIDHILCFETLEHVENPERLLSEFKRVLTPGGRITCSVPHDWSDESGSDPNPFHLHVYTRERFSTELERVFDVEYLIAQTADRIKKPGGGCIWVKRSRSLRYIEHTQSEIEAEWLLAVASKSPLGGSLVPYTETVFSDTEVHSAGHALAFARDYSNPWLVRAIVSMGLRTESSDLRKRWSLAVLGESEGDSADHGAALCVLAYAELSSTDAPVVEWLMPLIEEYLKRTEQSTNPTVFRWRVSLMYVAGMLNLARGETSEANSLFQQILRAPVVDYSATLLTKPAEAADYLGRLLAGAGKESEATDLWFNAAKKIINSLGERISQGYEFIPPSFEIREMAAAFSIAGRLLAAASSAQRLVSAPCVFFDELRGDIVSQTQALHAAEVRIGNLEKDIRLKDSGFEELFRGKEWLEAQWSALTRERTQMMETIHSLESGKDWLETQWRASEGERVRLQEAMSSLVTGKEWLEAQWKSSEGERVRLQEALRSLETGKEWLEAQWKASDGERVRLQEAISSLVMGKEWLETQWKASEAERIQLQGVLISLQAGKDWLESQWRLQLQELNSRQQLIQSRQLEINCLEDRVSEYERELQNKNEEITRISFDRSDLQDKLARLNRNWMFRLLRRFGFLNFL